MAFTERYANFDLATGTNDGTSEANAWQTPAAVIAGVAAGNRVNIKRQAAPYDLTSTVSFNVNGTSTAPIWYRAYTSTIGDGGMWEVAYNSGGIAALQFTGDFCIVEGVDFQPGAVTNINAFNADGACTWAIRCRVHARGTVQVSNCLFCDIEQSRDSDHIQLQGTNSYNATVLYSRFTQAVASTEAYLIRSDGYARSLSIIGCQFAGIGSVGQDGIFLDRQDSAQGGVLLVGNTFYNLDSGITVDEEPNAYREDIRVINNVFSVMAGYAVERTNIEVGYVDLLGNFYHSCTSGFTNYAVESEQFVNTALSASPFVTPGTDFTINETANGGAVLRARGFPVLPAYDWDNMDFYPTYSGPSASEIAEAVWTRTGRTLTS